MIPITKSRISSNSVQNKISTHLANPGIPYWLSPIFTTTVVIVVSMMIFTFTSEKVFDQEFRSNKVDVGISVFTYGVILSTILLGIYLGQLIAGVVGEKRSQRSRIAMIPKAAPLLKFIGYLAAFAALFAYAVYFSMSAISLEMFIAAIRGDSGANYALRGAMERTAGLTSFMSVACWWFAYAAFKALVLEKKLSQGEKVLSGVLFACVVARSFAENERRAIIDILIPAIIIVIFCRKAWTKRTYKILLLAPVVGVVGLCGLFMVTEYFRTWASFYADTSNSSYVEWALTRLGGYYSTSVNNGMTAVTNEFSAHGYYLLHGLYRFPIISDALGLGDLRIQAHQDFMRILLLHANPEFNNQGGAIVAIMDLGYLGGGFLLMVFGFFSGFCFQKARQGSIPALIYYTFFFFSSLEITRVWYFTNAVSFTNLIFITLALFIWEMGSQPTLNHARRRSSAGGRAYPPRLPRN